MSSKDRRKNIMDSLGKRDNSNLENKGKLVQELSAPLPADSFNNTSVEQIDNTHKEETKNVDLKPIHEIDTTGVDKEQTQETDTNIGHKKRTHEYDTKNVHIQGSEPSEDSNPVESFVQLMKKKERVEDTHTRKTFIVRKDLLKRFEKLHKKHGRGFQMWFINEAIERLLDEIETKKK